MDYEAMKAMLETHCCAQCEAPLSLVWDGDADKHDLGCGTDHSHKGYKRVPSISQALARGEADKHLGEGTQQDLEKLAKRVAAPLSMLPEKDVASGELIPRDKFLALVKWGESLSLKPYLGHVCLYFGKPYVTIDGYYYLLAKRQPDIRIGTRPLTVDERQQFQLADSDHTWLAEAWENGEKLPTTGLGLVTMQEVQGKSTRKPEQFRAPIVHDHPQRMAEKRAEWQLLRKLIPLEEVE